MAVIVFKLLSCKVLFITEKTMETVKKKAIFQENCNFTSKLLQSNE